MTTTPTTTITVQQFGVSKESRRRRRRRRWWWWWWRRGRRVAVVVVAFLYYFFVKIFHEFMISSPTRPRRRWQRIQRTRGRRSVFLRNSSATFNGLFLFRCTESMISAFECECVRVRVCVMYDRWSLLNSPILISWHVNSTTHTLLRR